MYEDENMFNEETLQNGLAALIRGDADPEEMCWENLDVSTYDDAGILTYDKGLVIQLPDGSEYQLTIVRSR